MLWRCRYRYRGKEKLLALGSYLGITLSEAGVLKGEAAFRQCHRSKSKKESRISKTIDQIRDRFGKDLTEIGTEATGNPNSKEPLNRG